MTQFDSYAPRLASTTRSPDDTIYRDTPVAGLRTGGRTVVPPHRFRMFARLPQTEHVSDGILAGLAGLTLPVVVYSFVQLWSLMATGSLQHAVRAFLP